MCCKSIDKSLEGAQKSPTPASSSHKNPKSSSESVVIVPQGQKGDAFKDDAISYGKKTLSEMERWIKAQGLDQAHHKHAAKQSMTPARDPKQ